jgi:cardiolipin synthase
MFDALVDRFAIRSPRAAAPLLWLRKHRQTRRALIIAFCHLLGAITSIHAILGVRTSQGAIAWAVSLNTFPYIAVPAYWVFGRSNFEG